MAIQSSPGYGTRLDVTANSYVDLGSAKSFNASSPLTSAFNVSADPYASSAPAKNMTALQALTHGKNFGPVAVAKTDVQQHTLSAGSTNAVKPQVDTKLNKLESVGQQVKDAKANITEIFDKARAQIREAASEIGMNADALAPDDDGTSADSVAELGLKAVGQQVMTFVGGGSIGTMGNVVSSRADEIADKKSLKGLSKDQAAAVIMERVIAKQEAAEARQEFSRVMGPATGGDKQRSDLTLNFKKLNEQQGAGVLKDIMTPGSERNTPEFKALEDLDVKKDNVVDRVIDADENAYSKAGAGDIQHAILTNDAGAKKEIIANNDLPEETERVLLSSQEMKDLTSGFKGISFDDIDRDVKQAMAAFTNEPKRVLSPSAAFAPSASSMMS